MSLSGYYCNHYGETALNTTCFEFALLPVACDRVFETVRNECRRHSVAQLPAAQVGGSFEVVPRLAIAFNVSNFVRMVVDSSDESHGQFVLHLPLPSEHRHTAAAREALGKCGRALRRLHERSYSGRVEAAVTADGATVAAVSEHQLALLPVDDGVADCSDVLEVAPMLRVQQVRGAAEHLSEVLCGRATLGVQACSRVRKHAVRAALEGLDDWYARRVLRDKWLAASHSLQGVADLYNNDPTTHNHIVSAFTALTNRDSLLSAHRDFVEEHDLGVGERAFHWMWNLIVASMPPSFTFLEIGVYKGQVPSLVALLARQMSKAVSLFGITPLSPRTHGDVDGNADRFPDTDYVAAINSLFTEFDMDPAEFAIWQGLSTDVDIVGRARTEMPPLDVLFIDGGHEYDVVVSDLNVYLPLLRVGGLLVIDDCANNLNTNEAFPGIPSVARAVDEVLPPLAQGARAAVGHGFEVVLAVGHDRVWRKIV